MSFPRTRQEAEKWNYGNSDARGNYRAPYNPDRCAYAVTDPPWYIDQHQCSRKPGHGPDGMFCKQHAKKVIDLMAFWAELEAARVGARGDTQS